MYYLVSIDKRKEYYNTYNQHNKYSYNQRYIEHKINIKEDEASDEANNEHNKPLRAMSKL